MTLLRSEDFPEGRFTLAFVGNGPETGNTVIELTHNWDQKAPCQIDSRLRPFRSWRDGHLRCLRGACGAGRQYSAETRAEEAWSYLHRFIEDPDGYRIELIGLDTER